VMALKLMNHKSKNVLEKNNGFGVVQKIIQHETLTTQRSNCSQELWPQELPHSKIYLF